MSRFAVGPTTGRRQSIRNHKLFNKKELSSPMYNKEEMKKRTKEFALRVIKLTESLPKTPSAAAIGAQLVRSGTSVGANYRAACRAKSDRDFIHKLSIVEEEGDESLFWIEVLVESGLIAAQRTEKLLADGNQIVAMTVASIKTTKARRSRQP